MNNKEFLLQQEQEMLDKYCEIIYEMKKEIAKEVTFTDDEFWDKLDELMVLDENETRELYIKTFDLEEFWEEICRYE